MDLNKKILTLLAIFCVIASAGVVCAADYGGYAGSNYQNMNGVSGSQYYQNNGHQVPLGLESGSALENQTGNATGNAASNITGNTTGNTTSNSTNATSTHTMPATGNPIIGLLAVTSIIGCYAVLRRDE